MMKTDYQGVVNDLKRYMLFLQTMGRKTVWMKTSPAAVPDRGWEVLREEVCSCRRCALHRTRTNVVFGTGDPHADLLVIGEAPGFEEDRKAEPFVGDAGKLLDKMLEAISLSRKTVYIANVLKCRPPRNRDPLPEEIDQCRSFLERQIKSIRPKLILALGAFAARTLLGSKRGITALREGLHDYQGTPLKASFHPAYLLRSPGKKAQAWEDLKEVKRFLGI